MRSLPLPAAIGRAASALQGDHPQRLTNAAVARRMEALGIEISGQRFSQIKGGQADSIAVAQWLALAHALDVAPPSLLAPENTGVDAVNFAAEGRGASLSSTTLVDWLLARRALPGQDDQRFRDARPAALLVAEAPGVEMNSAMLQAQDATASFIGALRSGKRNEIRRAVQRLRRLLDSTEYEISTASTRARRSQQGVSRVSKKSAE